MSEATGRYFGLAGALFGVGGLSVFFATRTEAKVLLVAGIVLATGGIVAFSLAVRSYLRTGG